MKIKNIKVDDFVQVLSNMAPAYAGNEGRIVMTASANNANKALITAYNGVIMMSTVIRCELEDEGGVLTISPDKLLAVLSGLKGQDYLMSFKLESKLFVTITGDELARALDFSFDVLKDSDASNQIGERLFSFSMSAKNAYHMIRTGGSCYDREKKGNVGFVTQVHMTLKEYEPGRYDITTVSTNNATCAYCGGVGVSDLLAPCLQDADDKERATRLGVSVLGEHASCILSILKLYADTDKPCQFTIAAAGMSIKIGAFILQVPVTATTPSTLEANILAIVDKACKSSVCYTMKAHALSDAAKLALATNKGNSEMVNNKVMISQEKGAKDYLTLTMTNGNAELPIPCEPESDDKRLDDWLVFNAKFLKHVADLSEREDNIGVFISVSSTAMVVDAGTYQCLILGIDKNV